MIMSNLHFTPQLKHIRLSHILYVSLIVLFKPEISLVWFCKPLFQLLMPVCIFPNQNDMMPGSFVSVHESQALKQKWTLLQVQMTQWLFWDSWLGKAEFLVLYSSTLAAITKKRFKLLAFCFSCCAIFCLLLPFLVLVVLILLVLLLLV